VGDFPNFDLWLGDFEFRVFCGGWIEVSDKNSMIFVEGQKKN
jgi:hypothetical protein